MAGPGGDGGMRGNCRRRTVGAAGKPFFAEMLATGKSAAHAASATGME